MDQLQQVTNVKNNPSILTSSCSLETPNKQENYSFEVESDCLPISAVYIKTEMSPKYDMEYEMEEPLVKIECEDLFDETEQDPLDDSNKIKVPDEACDKHEEPKTSENRTSNTRSKKTRVVCNICNTSFSRQSGLNSHMLLHTGIKPYACRECNKTFARKYNLDVHERRHTDEDQHICDYCDQPFSSKTCLILHIRRHTGEKPFSCPTCNKSFSSTSNFRYHKRTTRH